MPLFDRAEALRIIAAKLEAERLARDADPFGGPIDEELPIDFGWIGWACQHVAEENGWRSVTNTPRSPYGGTIGTFLNNYFTESDSAI